MRKNQTARTALARLLVTGQAARAARDQFRTASDRCHSFQLLDNSACSGQALNCRRNSAAGPIAKRVGTAVATAWTAWDLFVVNSSSVRSLRVEEHRSTACPCFCPEGQIR